MELVLKKGGLNSQVNKMKIKSFIISFFILSYAQLFAQLPTRGCGTLVPSVQYDSLFQQKVINYLNHTSAINRVQATYQIPVIIHVIHGGEAIGTFPNLTQGQLNSQIQVLNDDYGGVGFNNANYPTSAFQSYATNTLITAASKDGTGRIGISNTGISFCLALRDTLGNVLAEPGIERINWNTISGASSPSAATTYTAFTNLMNNIIKPATIWTPSKFLNIWVSDVNTGISVIGYSNFPPLSSLTGISGSGTSTTDGLWCWAKVFGSQNIYSTGVYNPPYNLGRTATHELSHYFGIRHTWGDGSCLTDYCNDTPSAQAATYGGTAIYPYLPNNCTATVPPTGSEGIMFMNFADYSDDASVYMFTNDQKNRMQTAMTNSPYRNQLGTHGFCSASSTPTANFSLSSTNISTGQSLSITDLSSPVGLITSWNYKCTASTPTLSTLQSPTFTFNVTGIFTISLTVTNSAGLNSTITKTIQVAACTTPTVNLATTNPLCNGVCNGSATITASGGAPFTYNWIATTTNSTSVASSLCAGNYSCIVTNSCGLSFTKPVVISQPPAISLIAYPLNSSVCVGSTTSLFASTSGSSYTVQSLTWNNGLIGASVTVTPSVLPKTNYTVTALYNNVCSITATTSINVFPNPTVNIFPSTSSICKGNNVTLTANGASTYTWASGITSSSVIVTPTVTTTYSVNGTDANNCTNSALTTITVLQSPTVTISKINSTFCVGATNTLVASGANTYTWLPGSSNSATLVVTPTSASNYTLIASNTQGCLTSSTIAANPIPSITVTPANQIMCAGKTATLNLSGALNYTTNPGGIVLSSFTVNPVTTTIYTISGVSALGCFGIRRDTVKVVVLPSILSNVNSSTICPGSVLTFSNSGGATYTLSPTALTGSVINTFPTTAGTTIYTITGTGPAGNCINSKTISITVFNLPTISISPASPSVCSGKSIVLSASGANTYTWNTGSNGAALTAFPTANTSYSVLGKNTSGCESSASTTVNVITTPIVSIASPSTNVCYGYTMTLTASGATNYLWFNGATTNTINVQPISNATYVVKGNNGGTCFDTAFVSITSLPAPTVLATANNTLVCSGQTVNLSGTGTSINYLWKPGNLLGANQTVQINSPTTYTLYGQGSNGCAFLSEIYINTKTATSVVSIVTPSAVCVGDSAVLSVIGGYVPLWSNNAIPNTLVVNPTVNTTYTFIANDFNGCVSTISFNVDINVDCTVNVYNGFTPNGDGINDVWIIDNIEKYPNNKVFVYNRWGNKIFETEHYNNINNNWDGKLKGRALTSGTYFYIIETDNGKLFKKGWIELTN